MSREVEHDPELIRLYEAAYLVNPGVSAEEAAGAIAPLKDLFAKEGARTVAEEPPTLRSLAYPIKKHTSAFFGWIRFEAEAGTVLRVKTLLTARPDVLRFLLVKADKPAVSVVPVRSPRSLHTSSLHAALVSTEEQKPPKPALSDEELNRRIEEMVGKE